MTQDVCIRRSARFRRSFADDPDCAQKAGRGDGGAGVRSLVRAAAGRAVDVCPRREARSVPGEGQLASDGFIRLGTVIVHHQSVYDKRTDAV